jgi:hypothetical protein
VKIDRDCAAVDGDGVVFAGSLDAAALTAMQGWYSGSEQQRYFVQKGF